MRSIILVLFLSAFAAGCAPTIGSMQDTNDVYFTPGQTSKNEVLDTLGLPSEVTRSEALKTEYWAYKEGTELVGLILPVGTAAGGVTTQTVSVNGASTEFNFDDAAVVYIFDENGTLLEARYPNKEH